MIKPSEVKSKALKLEEQNYKFRAFLRNRADYDELDEQFLTLHKELFADNNCCNCGNCCKEFEITLGEDEIKRIAAFLNVTESDFATEYLKKAKPYDDNPFEFKSKPCAFLEADGRCRIQECKPDDCTGFPFTDRPNRMSSLLGVISHAEVCPVVFEILERLKVIYRFRNR